MISPSANDFQYFFLGGILGEILEISFVGNYLKENQSILNDMGIEDIQCLTLNSFNSAHENAKDLVEILKKEFVARNKKIIIFAHSKGCLEALLALHHDEDFFEEAVVRIICVQPPFQGSEVVSSSLLRPMLKFWPGLNSLKKDFYLKIFQNELLKSAVCQKYLKDKLLVIRAYKSLSRDVSWIIRPIHFMYKKNGIENDGLLKLSEQTLHNAHYEDIILEMDHSDLFTSTKLSNKNRIFRKNLMTDLINQSIEKYENFPNSDDDLHKNIPLKLNTMEESIAP